METDGTMPIGPRVVEVTYLDGDRVVGRKTMVLDGDAVRRWAAEVEVKGYRKSLVSGGEE